MMRTRQSVMLGRSWRENYSPASSPFLRLAVSRPALLRITKNPDPALQPRILRRCSCRGPERHFLHYYTFPDSRILARLILRQIAVARFFRYRAWPPRAERVRMAASGDDDDDGSVCQSACTVMASSLGGLADVLELDPGVGFLAALEQRVAAEGDDDAQVSRPAATRTALMVVNLRVSGGWSTGVRSGTTRTPTPPAAAGRARAGTAHNRRARSPRPPRPPRRSRPAR